MEGSRFTPLDEEHESLGKPLDPTTRDAVIHQIEIATHIGGLKGDALHDSITGHFSDDILYAFLSDPENVAQIDISALDVGARDPFGGIDAA